MARKNLKGGATEPVSGQLSLDCFFGERIVEVPLEELNAPDPHPFIVRDDEAMNSLVESITKFGVLDPGLARPLKEGGYELLCGNRRKHACEIIGRPTLPVIVREMDDLAAVNAMVDTNIFQRDKLLLSEKAWAYKVKMDALNHNGVKAEHNSVDIITAQTGENKSYIFRLIRLTELVEVILDMVDDRKLAFSTGVELSYLSYDEQFIVADNMEKLGIKPSLSQAARMKQLRKDGKLTPEVIESILAESKQSPVGEQTIRLKYRRYFPPDYSPKQIEMVIIGLLRDWKAGAVV